MVGEKMREILFRGKRDKRYGKDWTYGVPYIDHENDCIIATHCSKRVVIPETVGEFTGATDKNGKKIFEGDIVRYELSAYGKSLTKDYEIVFHNYSWGCKNEKGNISRLDLFEPSLLEVIGNKHEK